MPSLIPEVDALDSKLSSGLILSQPTEDEDQDIDASMPILSVAPTSLVSEATPPTLTVHHNSPTTASQAEQEDVVEVISDSKDDSVIYISTGEIRPRKLDFSISAYSAIKSPSPVANSNNREAERSALPTNDKGIVQPSKSAVDCFAKLDLPQSVTRKCREPLKIPPKKIVEETKKKPIRIMKTDLRHLEWPNTKHVRVRVIGQVEPKVLLLGVEKETIEEYYEYIQKSISKFCNENQELAGGYVPM